jgi:adenylate cyclase
LLIALNPGGLPDRLFGMPSVGPIRSLAVLPLENLSGEPQQEYFAGGMTEAIALTTSDVRLEYVLT